MISRSRAASIVFAGAMIGALSTLVVPPAFAQRLDPVQWTLTADAAKAAPGAAVPLRFTGKIDPGWHVYSLTTPDGGPIRTTAGLAANEAVESFKIYQPKPEHRFDKNFNLDTEVFSDDVPLIVLGKLSSGAKAGPIELKAEVRYQTCDDRQCLPPRKKEASVTITVDPAASASATAWTPPAGYFDINGPKPPDTGSSSDGKGGLLSFALVAFGAGLAAIFTPCVFPMIPITVSFFINQRGGILQAIVFASGIVVLFCALALGVTAAAGPFGVVQLSANPWVNGFIALVFGVFATSLMGAFELTLPSSLLTKFDTASRRGGYLGTLLMGLTFALSSFACVGPFVGSLLAASVQTKGSQPLIGMAAFSGGLASPFFVLAAFPGLLKKMPRSGGWLARVKVVMGFVLLAAMLKYLGNIDQVLQLGWLTRERFLAGWFVLFALPGLYLLGLLRLEGIEKDEPLGVARTLVASLFLMFALSLLPGMFGAPLGGIDAFVPAGTGSVLGARAEPGPAWMKNQLQQALDQARSESKLVLVDFTGYACTNCHWMKANLFPKPEIKAALEEHVRVELYTDGTDTASEENQKLEDTKFNTVSLPYYALLDADQKVVATFPNGDQDLKDPAQFLAFLQSRSPRAAE